MRWVSPYKDFYRNEPQAKQKPKLCIKSHNFGWPVQWEYFHHVNVIFELLGRPDERKEFDQYMEKSLLQDGRPCFKCTLCGKQNSLKTNVRNHIESVHFPGHFSYNCNHCKKTFKAKNALCVHVSLMHRNEKMWCNMSIACPIFMLLWSYRSSAIQNKLA